jgi:hypothetical protein
MFIFLSRESEKLRQRCCCAEQFNDSLDIVRLELPTQSQRCLTVAVNNAWIGAGVKQQRNHVHLADACGKVKCTCIAIVGASVHVHQAIGEQQTNAFAVTVPRGIVQRSPSIVIFGIHIYIIAICQQQPQRFRIATLSCRVHFEFIFPR